MDRRGRLVQAGGCGEESRSRIRTCTRAKSQVLAPQHTHRRLLPQPRSCRPRRAEGMTQAKPLDGRARVPPLPPTNKSPDRSHVSDSPFCHYVGRWRPSTASWRRRPGGADATAGGGGCQLVGQVLGYLDVLNSCFYIIN